MQQKVGKKARTSFAEWLGTDTFLSPAQVAGDGRRTGSGQVSLVTPARYVPQPGAELTIDYGAKSNEELLFLYGVLPASVAFNSVQSDNRVMLCYTMSMVLAAPNGRSMLSLLLILLGTQNTSNSSPCTV